MYKNLTKSYKDLFNQQDLDAAAVDVDTEAEPEPEPIAEPYDTDEENDLTPEEMLVSLFEGILIN